MHWPLQRKAKARAKSADLSVEWLPFFTWAPMDLRIVLVATPILLAAGWAAFNIGRAAVGQLQLMLKRARG
jgi:photosystem II PsbY protein